MWLGQLLLWTLCVTMMSWEYFKALFFDITTMICPASSIAVANYCIVEIASPGKQQPGRRLARAAATTAAQQRFSGEDRGHSADHHHSAASSPRRLWTAVHSHQWDPLSCLLPTPWCSLLWCLLVCLQLLVSQAVTKCLKQCRSRKALGAKSSISLST